MTSVDELVESARGLLDRADEEAAKMGNGGVSAARLTERAGITATLAVATAIQAQQAAASQTAAAVAEAREQMQALGQQVADLQAGRHPLATAVVDLGPLTVGTRDVTVSWGRNLGDASYQVDLILDDVVLGRARAVVKTTYATSAVVTVTTALAVIDATKLQASAWRGL